MKKLSKAVSLLGVVVPLSVAMSAVLAAPLASADIPNLAGLTVRSTLAPSDLPPSHGTIQERPRLHLSKHGNRVRIAVTTHPPLKHKAVHFYVVSDGDIHIIGSSVTGSTGTAVIHKTFKPGTYRLTARPLHPGKKISNHYARIEKVHIS